MMTLVRKMTNIHKFIVCRDINLDNGIYSIQLDKRSLYNDIFNTDEQYWPFGTNNKTNPIYIVKYISGGKTGDYRN
jgi:hypothetical protein